MATPEIGNVPLVIPVIDQDQRNYTKAAVNVNRPLSRTIINWLETEFLVETLHIHPGVITLYEHNLLQNRPVGTVTKTVFYKGDSTVLDNTPDAQAQEAYFRSFVPDENVILQSVTPQGFNVTRVTRGFRPPVNRVETITTPGQPRTSEQQPGPSFK